MFRFIATLTVWHSTVAVAAPQKWAHPGVLVGAADVSAARARLSAKEEPTFSFFAAASASPQGASTYKPMGPPSDGFISCGYYDKPSA